MRLNGKIPLLIALGLAVSAGLVAYGSLAAARRSAREGWELETVLVAAEALPAGQPLTLAQLAQRPIPAQFATRSVVRPRDAELILGQPLLVPLETGDPITWGALESASPESAVSDVVQQALRGVAIPVSGVAAAGGAVRPNDAVDVIGIFRDPRSDELVATTLMQNVLVVALGDRTQLGRGKESQLPQGSVTLQLMPEEAEILLLAAKLGDLTLTLRNRKDLSRLGDRGSTTVATLFSGERRALDEVRRNVEGRGIVVHRGSASSVEH